MFLNFVFGSLLVGATSAPLKIELTSSSEINGAYPLLGDVALIEGDEERVAEARMVILGKIVLPGRRQRYSRVEIARSLTDSGVETDNILWAGAQEVEVTRKQALLKKSEVERRLRTELMERFDISGENLELRISGWRDVNVPASDFHAKVELEQERIGKRMSALLSIHSGGRLLRKLRVELEVKQWAMAITATQNLASRTQLTPEILEMAVVDVLATNGPAILSLDDLVGSRLLRPIAPGQVIAQGDVEKIPAVVKGNAVDVIYASSGIVIKMKGVALEDGVIGGSVMATLANSDTPVRIRVTGRMKGRIENEV